jgi:stress response protein YsnF
VRLDKQTVTSNETVSGEVRKEEIEVDGADDTRRGNDLGDDTRRGNNL